MSTTSDPATPDRVWVVDFGVAGFFGPFTTISAAREWAGEYGGPVTGQRQGVIRVVNAPTKTSKAR